MEDRAKTTQAARPLAWRHDPLRGYAAERAAEESASERRIVQAQLGRYQQARLHFAEGLRLSRLVGDLNGKARR